MIKKLTTYENDERMKSPFWQSMKDKHDKDHAFAIKYSKIQCRLDNDDF